MKEKIMSRKRLVRIALGRDSADVVVRGGRVVDVYTGEIRHADVAVGDGRIAAVGQLPPEAIGPRTKVIEAEGLFVSPGLIDSHLHYHHTYLDPAEASKLLLLRGVTGTVDGFYGEAIVGGKEAVRAIKDGIAHLPIRLLFLSPTQAYLQNRMFGLKPAKAVSPADLEEMLGWDGCYGLDETPFSCIVDEDPDMMALFEKTLAAGKVVTGHVSGASEAEVQAFVAMGGTVDHEAVNVEETFVRARSGMKVLMRFGSGVPDLPNLIGAYTERGMDPRQLSVCTDVLLPEALAAGALDVAVRRIIAAGVQPAAAIAMGSLNVAETFYADRDLGSISPGRYADMLLIDDLAKLSVQAVIFGGDIVVESGKLLVDPPRPVYPDVMYHTVKMPLKPTVADFKVSTNRADGEVKVRCVGVSSTSLATEERHATLEACDGVILPDIDKDVAFLAMVDRLDKHSGMAVAFAHGFGLKSGAMASTHNAVCENLAIVGTNAADMVHAVNALHEIGGGQIVIRDGEILAVFPMPVLGLFSDLPYTEVLAKREEMQNAANSIGCILIDPFLKLEFAFAAAEFPHLRMSEEGLIRTKPRERVSIELEDAVVLAK
jgi:adenine deaminase